MSPRLRRDALVRSLRRSGLSTVEALATEVGASKRTVLRDISVLRDEGFVIDTECGRGGGVQLDPNSMQTTTRLSVPEVFALLISVAAMRVSQILPFSDLADQGLAKIEKSLPAEKVRDLRLFLECLYVGQVSPDQDLSNVGTIDPNLLPVFETAFLKRIPLQFGYRDAKGNETQRIVEPQAMLILPPLWYLVAWDPGRADFRYFRMDRISAPSLVDASPFRRRHVTFEGEVRPISKPKP